MNSWYFDLLCLTEEGVAPLRTRVMQSFGHTALRACVEREYCGAAHAWESFRQLDFSIQWRLEFHRLAAGNDSLDDLVPGDVNVGSLGLSELLWSGIPTPPALLALPDDHDHGGGDGGPGVGGNGGPPESDRDSDDDRQEEVMPEDMECSSSGSSDDGDDLEALVPLGLRIALEQLGWDGEDDADVDEGCGADVDDQVDRKPLRHPSRARIAFVNVNVAL